MKRQYSIIFVILFLWSGFCFSEELSSSPVKQPSKPAMLSPQKKETTPLGPAPVFSVGLYKTNYLLPFYYNPQTNDPVYAGHTPGNQALDKEELKFQFSFKVPVLTDVFSEKNSIVAAYTQQSYWQAYNHSAFFRETNYEPEIFFSRAVHHVWANNAEFDFVNVGLVHQSNGQGAALERSWNRAYADFIFSDGRWLLDVRPWLVFRDPAYRLHNPDMRHYLGNGRIGVSYKWGKSTLSMMGRNWVESGFQRGGSEFSWSIPISKTIRFYTDVFTGYGQSLIDYDHRTTSVGVGFSLNDWE